MLIPTDLLKAALLCASNEETRYYLKGVHLSTSGHMVTTDGHRMFVAKLAEAVPADVIIPLDSVKAALKIAGPRAIVIELNGNTLGSVTFVPVDGTFPNWRAVLPAGEGAAYAPTTPEEAPHLAHFNPEYVGDIGKMSKILSGAVGSFKLQVWTATNPAGVTFAGRDDCLAVLMPMRRPTGDVVPEWRNVLANVK